MIDSPLGTESARRLPRSIGHAVFVARDCLQMSARVCLPCRAVRCDAKDSVILLYVALL